MTNPPGPDLWGSVHAMLRAGQDPTVWVTYSMLTLPARKKPGRKRVVRLEPEVKREAELVLGGQAKPRCINPHCRAILKKGADKTRQVCGEGCRIPALSAYRAIVALLEGPEYGEEDVGLAAEVDGARRAFLGARIKTRRRAANR